MNSNRNTKNTEGAINNPTETTILLVEDDDAVRELLTLVLRTKGYEVIDLSDGMEALNFLAALCAFNDAQSYPDIIISDIQMPVFTGLDLLVGIGECRPLPPFILFTGFDDSDLFEEAYRLGAKRILKKPFSPEVLCQAISDVLTDSQADVTAPKTVSSLNYEQLEPRF